MTGTERLVAAVNGGPADRIPVFCNLLDHGARELGMSLEEYYSKGEYVAEAQLKMRVKYGYDNVWGLFYAGKAAELLGCRRMIYSDDGPPNVGEMVIRSLEDIPRLQVPSSVTDHPGFEEVRKGMDILKREVKGKYPLCAYITAPMTLPAMLMGMEKWLPLLLNGPEEPRNELLEKCHEFFVLEVEAYRAAGADILIYSNPFGSTDFVSHDFFRERSLPWIKKDMAVVGSGDMVYYCGSARFNKVIDEVFSETRIPSYYLSPLDDLTEGKLILANRGLCCGIINDIRMIDWTPEQVRAEVKRLVEAGKPGGNFLLGTLVMPYQIPDENIRAFMDAAVEYGSW